MDRQDWAVSQRSTVRKQLVTRLTPFNKLSKLCISFFQCFRFLFSLFFFFSSADNCCFLTTVDTSGLSGVAFLSCGLEPLVIKFCSLLELVEPLLCATCRPCGCAWSFLIWRSNNYSYYSKGRTSWQVHSDGTIARPKLLKLPAWKKTKLFKVTLAFINLIVKKIRLSSCDMHHKGTSYWIAHSTVSPRVICTDSNGILVHLETLMGFVSTKSAQKTLAFDAQIGKMQDRVSDATILRGQSVAGDSRAKLEIQTLAVWKSKLIGNTASTLGRSGICS